MSRLPLLTKKDVDEWAKADTPQRTRDYHNNHFNSDKWDAFQARKGDIVVDTCYKSGTTWTQAIMLHIVFKGNVPGFGKPGFGILDMTPWVDMRLMTPVATAGLLDAQEHRRVMKSHLPLDGLPYNPDTKYIVLGRDLRDVAYSWLNHWKSMWLFYDNCFNLIPGMIGPGIPDPKDWDGPKCFRGMSEGDAVDLEMWSYFHHLATWWAYRHLPNVHMVHFNQMKADPKKEIKAMVDFVGEELTDEELDLVVQKTEFNFMRENNEAFLGGLAGFLEGGGKSFIHKGTNYRWKGELSDEDIEKYLEIGKERLGEECMHWLVSGGETLQK
jgi:aryl sulfotransferase